jgi:hypothetical protein
MTGYGDAGEEVIGRLGARLGCDTDDLTLWHRGLTWHPAGLTQHIWAETAGRGTAIAGWRVHIRTWCLKRVVASAAQTAALSATIADNSIGALIRKPGSPSRVGFGASMRMDDVHVDWTARFLAAVARLQVHDAVRLTDSRLVLDAGAAPDMATDRLGAAVAGTRTLPAALDPTLMPSVAIDALPFAEVADALRLHDGVRAIATHGGVTASFPWIADGHKHEFVLLEIRPSARRALGAGISIALSLPLPAPVTLLHALTLNEAELQPDSPTDLLGGWVVRDASLMHEAFVPWHLCNGEVVRHLAESAGRRAAWLRMAGRSIVPADWPNEGPGRVLLFKRTF